jgi:cysteinyl-tRNA synthetase
MKLFNSLSNKKEVFVPHIEQKVGMYHCGPTVYDYVHIGNLRSFLLGDLLRRSYEYLNYDVLQVMNITDIGHLVSDGDDGEDKMTKALKREGKDLTLKNMLELADFYTNAFIDDLESLNIQKPHHLPKASDHIQEDINLITKLQNQGYTYTTSDGVYFDSSKMPDYGKLGGLGPHEASIQRIISNSEKRQQADFALWKFDEHQGWDSPWGQGFPGWHIECSGMSMKYLGEQFDIHTGGIDNKSVHHNNEIAQSECATGCTPFVRYWLHGEMLTFGGEKLSKSTGGNITIKKLKEKTIDPLAYRYLCLQTHYRSKMSFSFDVLASTQESLERIYRTVTRIRNEANKEGEPDPSYTAQFTEKISDDLNTPQALAVFHEVLKSSLEPHIKYATLCSFDKVLGLALEQRSEQHEVPQEVLQLLEQRKEARLQQHWESSDELRKKIQAHGYQVHDSGSDQRIEKI